MTTKKRYTWLVALLSITFAITAQNGANKQSDTVFDVNKEAQWLSIFTKGGLGTAYEIDADHKDAHRLFDVKKNRIEVLYNWPDGEAPFGMITTTKQYSHYNFEFKYKWGTRRFIPRDTVKRDAGLLFHVQGEKKVWPSSLECQVQEGDTGDLWVIKGPKVTVVKQDGTTKVIDASGEKKFQRNSKFENHEKKGWNHVRVEVRGATSARFFVNGHLVNHLTGFSKNGDPLNEGYISLQAEGAEITYKQIRLQDLK